MYAGSNGFIGRESLTDLRKFTMPEIFKQAATHYNLQAGKTIDYNGQDNYFQLFNGSRIYLLHMGYMPSDPEFHRFGSSEYMDGFVEEAAEITERSVSIIATRIRHRLTDFCRKCGKSGLSASHPVEIDELGRPIKWQCSHCKDVNGGHVPKMLITCNPNDGWLRSHFYEPFTKGSLPPERAFIPATVDDNKHLSIEYIRALEAAPEMDRRRLRYGDWDYSTASDTMFSYPDISAMFSERHGEGEYYITADIARLGKDRTVIGVWHGFTLVEIVELKQKRVNEVSDEIRGLMSRYDVKLRNVIVDEDGVGGGVQDVVGCKGFQNGSKANDSDRFSKLKDECFFKLAEYVEQGRIGIRVLDRRDVITKELQAVRRRKPDGDTKLAVISKDEMKVLLNGNSPDYADMLMMRMHTEVAKRGTISVRTINVAR